MKNKNKNNKKKQHKILTLIFVNLPNYPFVFLDFYSNFGVCDKTAQKKKQVKKSLIKLAIAGVEGLH